MALHHPIRLAEQVALIDHISKGRLIVGLGRGTAYNIYDYQGYGIDHTEAQARFEEAEAIMFEAWKGSRLIIAASSSICGCRNCARGVHQAASICDPRRGHRTRDAGYRSAGRPIHDERQNNVVTAQRLDLYRQTLREIGLDEAAIAAKDEECWVWRNVYVAETDAEAERIAVPAFIEMHEHRVAMRNRIYAEQKASILPMPPPGAAPPAHASVEHALVYGSPATVAEKLAPLKATGVGGLIIQFRLGPMSYEQTAHSLTLFNDKVIPAL